MMAEDPFSLDGSVILVTGASSGIGRQCAVTCSQRGARVILLGRDRGRLEETAEMLEPGPDPHPVHAVDLLDYDGVATAVKEAVSQTGKVHGAVHCAGISATLPLNALIPEKMDHFFRTNVVSSVHLTRQMIKPSHFSGEGGSIIFLASVMGVVGEKGKTLYSMTKGALLAAVRSMSLELAPRKIRVNCISPGVVESPMSEKAVYSRDEESLNRIRELHPLGLGAPEDVAHAAVFLLSGASRWITGTNLVVDGGYLSK